MLNENRAGFVRDEFSCKPNFDEAMARINAWYKGEIVDRAPVRFHGHNAQYDFGGAADWTPEQWKAHWFDFEEYGRIMRATDIGGLHYRASLHEAVVSLVSLDSVPGESQ